MNHKISSSPEFPGTLVRIGRLEADLKNRTCKVAGLALPVRRQVIELLCLLIECRPAVVARQEILSVLKCRSRKPATLVARVMVEVRRLIDLHGDGACRVLTSFGVGYRLAGEVSIVEVQGMGATDGLKLVAGSVHERLTLVRQALADPGSSTLARSHAEAALAMAIQNKHDGEKALALCWLARISLHCGEIETAARQFGHARSLAAPGANPALLAQLALTEGKLRLQAGDWDRVTTVLRQAHALLESHGADPLDTHECASALALAHERLGDLESARHWIGRAIRCATQATPSAMLACRAQELAIEQRMGDMQFDARQAEEAQLTWAAALRLCERLLQPGLDPAVSASSGLVAVQGSLLCRLGRFDEAMHVLAAGEHVLANEPAASKGRDINLAKLKFERAITLQRIGRPHDALHLLRHLLRSDVQEVSQLSNPDYMTFATAVAQQCGELELALTWARRHLQAQRQDDARRADLMEAIYKAENMHEDMRQELETVRLQIRRVETEISGLLLPQGRMT